MGDEQSLIRSTKKEFDDLDFIEAQKILCETDLKYLCRDILGFKDWDICHDELMEWEKQNANRRFKLYLLPRGHLKTSILTIGRTVQDLLRNPDELILLGSAVWGNAKSFLSELKDYLSEKTILPRLYGNFKSDRWNQDEIIVAQRRKPNKTVSVDTAGVEKSMTSQHYKIIRLDDLVTRENITTAEQMEKVVNFFRDVIKLLEPDGKLEVIGTRWHDADLYGHIIKELTKTDLAGDAFVTYKRSAIMDGKVIFPKKFSLEKLANIKIQIGTYNYACNYDNDPLSPEEQHFKPPIRQWEKLGDNAIHCVTFDPATSEKKNACDAVVMDSAVTQANQLCIVEYKAFKKKDPAAMIEKIFEYVLKYPNKNKTKKVGIEVNGGQEVYIKLIEEEQRRRNVFFEIVPIRQHVDKFSRILALQPRWESGNFLLKPGMVELEEQLLRFPIAERVDILDTASMAQQIMEPQYERKVRPYIPPEYRAA